MRIKILFLTEISTNIGMGHLKRVNNLIDYFFARGHDCHLMVKASSVANIDFMCPATLVESVDQVSQYIRTEHPELIIVDMLESEANVKIRNLISLSRQKFKLITIDDFYSNILIPDLEIKPWSNSPSLGDSLSGLKYLFFNQNFCSNLIKKVNKERINDVLISMGAADTNSATIKIICRLSKHFINIKFHAVIGPLFSEEDRLTISQIQCSNIVIYDGLEDLVDLYLKCDLAIIGGGQTKFETALFGIPALILSNTELERKLSVIYEGMGFSTYISPSKKIDYQMLISKINFLNDNPIKLKIMSIKARSTIDCDGGRRVVSYVEQKLFNASYPL